VERRSSGEVEPGVLTRDVRVARDRRALLSSEIARESGVSTEAVIRVLSDDPTPRDPADARRLSAWAAAALPPGIDLNDPTRWLRDSEH
jgi:hypothetical protein